MTHKTKPNRKLKMCWIYGNKVYPYISVIGKNGGKQYEQENSKETI